MSENGSGRDFLDENFQRLLPANLRSIPQSEQDAARDEVRQRTLVRLRRRAKLRRVLDFGLKAASLAAVFVIGAAVGRARPAASAPAAVKAADDPALRTTFYSARTDPMKITKLELVETDPMKLRFQTAEAMAERGDFSRAAFEYVAAAVKYPERPESIQAYRCAGDLFLQADDIERATGAYKDFIKRRGVKPGTPESGELVSHGGWLLAALASDTNVQRRTEQ